LKTLYEKRYFVSLWTANVHHFVISFLVIETFMNPTVCQENYPLAFLYDQTCRMTVDPYHVKILMCSFGYISYDLIMYVFFLDSSSALNKQTIMHHCIVITGYVLIQICGYGFPSQSNFLLMCELSTPFVNYRSMYKKEELGNPVPVFVTIAMFILFTIVRIILFPIMMGAMGEVMYYSWGYINNLRKFSMIFSIVLITGLYFLQLFWYKLMVVGLLKMCGCIKS
jgi:hypothetical protein